MYKYNALLLKVVDGKTIDASVDLGFHIHVCVRLQLADIVIHNVDEDASAQAFLAEYEGEMVIVASHKSKLEDGRYKYIADVSVLVGREQKDLSGMLVEKGFAEWWVRREGS